MGAKRMKMVTKPGLTRLALDAAIVVAVILSAIYVIIVEASANELDSPTVSTDSPTIADPVDS